MWFIWAALGVFIRILHKGLLTINSVQHNKLINIYIVDH